MDKARKPFWAKCRLCTHIWIVAYCGMDIQTFSEILKSCRCPMCGATSHQISPATQSDGELREPAQSMSSETAPK